MPTLGQMKTIFDELTGANDKMLLWPQMDVALFRCGFKIKAWELEFLSLKLDRLSFVQFHAAVKEGVFRRKLLKEKAAVSRAWSHIESRREMVMQAVVDIHYAQDGRPTLSQEEFESNMMKVFGSFGEFITDDDYEFISRLIFSSWSVDRDDGPLIQQSFPSLEEWSRVYPNIIHNAPLLTAQWFMNDKLDHGIFPRHHTRKGFSFIATYIYDQYLEFFLAKSNPNQINSVIGSHKWSHTPLALACCYGLLDKVKVIIRSKHLEVNKIAPIKLQRGMDSALHCAVRSGNAELIKILASHPDLMWNVVDSTRSAAILYAIKEGKRNIVQAFVTYGCDKIKWNSYDDSLPNINLHYRWQARKKGDIYTANSHLAIFEDLLNVSMLDWKSIATRALECDDVEALVIIFRNPHLIYDLKAAKRSFGIKRKTVEDCLVRVKEEHRRTGMNFSDAYDWLTGLLNYF